MRVILRVLILLVSIRVSFCGSRIETSISSGSPRNFGSFSTGAPANIGAGINYQQRQESKESWNQAQIQHRQDQIAAWKNYLPEDPFRFIDGATVFAKGNGWIKFGGKIVEVLPDGIRVRGRCKSLDDPIQFHEYEGEFFVANFPYTNNLHILVGEEFSDFTAEQAGTYVLSESNSIPKLDYGVIAIPPPPSPEEIEAVVRNAEAVVLHDQTVNAEAAKLLKLNQEQAANGDEYGLFRMGERYLNGDGVEKDLVKARDYLSKAAAQGSVQAGDLLKTLSP